MSCHLLFYLYVLCNVLNTVFFYEALVVFIHAQRAALPGAASSGGRGRMPTVGWPDAEILRAPARPATRFRAWPRGRRRCGGVAAGRQVDPAVVRGAHAAAGLRERPEAGSADPVQPVIPRVRRLTSCVAFSPSRGGPLRVVRS